MTGAIIQSRVASTRLPDKVLMDIAGKPMALRVVERLKMSQKLDNVVLAIPDTKENDVLEILAQENLLDFFRGPEQDVLERYFEAAKHFKVETIVRITSDCPFIDPEVADEIIMRHFLTKADYTSNVIERTFPRGLDVEVFSFSVLEKAFKEAREEHQREHVTPYFFENPDIFKTENIEAKGVLRRPDLRLTVDTKEDMELARKIYSHFGEKFFSTREVVEFLDKNPELKAINAKVQQKELKE